MSTFLVNSGRFTGSEFWATLGGLAFGVALSGALRWGARHRKSRAVLIPVGLYLSALAFLSAILVSGTEPGGVGAQWQNWGWFAGTAAVLGLAAFRFPRSVGLPVLVLGGVLSWLVAGALKDFVPLGPATVLPTVQPLNDRETVTIFAQKADLVTFPPPLNELPTLFRLRTSVTEPAQWWWPMIKSQGWARTMEAQAPANVMKFGIYRLVFAGDTLVWRLEKPEMVVPER